VLVGRKWFACLAVAAAALAIDQSAKALIGTFVKPGEELALVPGFAALVHAQQAGAALGLLARLSPELAPRALAVLAGLAALLLVQLLWRAPRSDVLSGTAVGLIAGGAAGNALDRVQLGAVIEFVKLDLRLFELPLFNLGDVAIAAGMALLILDLVAAEAGARPSSE
jgi:signal peptidase II